MRETRFGSYGKFIILFCREISKEDARRDRMLISDKLKL
jgi:hypothetical protein